MSQNPAHTPRRVLSPPAVTRFNLRTASSSEAVFSPPYVPGRPQQSSRVPTQPEPDAPSLGPATFTPPAQLPRPRIRTALPRPPAPTRALELPRRPAEATPRETERTEPGSWREIIARFERELGDVVDADEPAETDEEAPAATGIPDAGAPSGAVASDIPPPVLSQPSLSWELEAMTTPDYQPRSSPADGDATDWPVTAEEGTAVDPWEFDDTEPAAPAAGDEVEEILLDAPVDPWDIEAEPDDEQAADFPLDAFIVPAGVRPIPSGYDQEAVARRVALRLDELADELRSSGLAALGATAGTDELSRVLAAIVTGYVAREE